jgi:hypothetical protein
MMSQTIVMIRDNSPGNNYSGSIYDSVWVRQFHNNDVLLFVRIVV